MSCVVSLPLQVAIEIRNNNGESVVKETGTTIGDFTMLSSKILYVGGSPNPSELGDTPRVTDSYRGCLRRVRWKSLGYVNIGEGDTKYFVVNEECSCYEKPSVKSKKVQC